MNLNVHIIHSTDTVNSRQISPGLKNGSEVIARVISNNGGNNYSLSVGGQKINVTSHLALREGSIFKALIKVTDGGLILKILSEHVSTDLKTLSLTQNNLKNSNLLNILNMFNLNPTVESLKLLEFALSMGIKLDSGKLNRAYKASGENKELNKQEKSQIAILLEEKGINSLSDTVEKVFYGFYGEKNKKENENTGQSEFKKNSHKKITKDDIKKYFDQLEKENSVRKTGPLTFFNMVLPKKNDEAHWLVFPFEWDYNDYSGVIRVLYSRQTKSIQKIVLTCQNKEKNYSIVLYFKGKEVYSVKFGLNSDSDGFDAVHVKNCLSELFKDAEIQVMDFEELKGFAAEDMQIRIFNGEA